MLGEITAIRLQNTGFLQSSLTDEDLAPIREEVYKLLENSSNALKYNGNLVGHLQSQYGIFSIKEIMHNLLHPLVGEYMKNFPDFAYDKDDYALDNIWVNFQTRTEFNPLHYHLGRFSYALWLKVPYLIEDERAIFPYIKDEENLTGCFVFYYPDNGEQNGGIARHVIPTDRTYENKLIFFPANLNHCVYPYYTTNELRISLSGNFT
jgi:hypothetical protein